MLEPSSPSNAPLARRVAIGGLLYSALGVSTAHAETVVNPYAPNYVERKKDDGDGGFFAFVGNSIVTVGFVGVLGAGLKTVFDLGKANDEAGNLIVGDKAFSAPTEKEILDGQRRGAKKSRNIFDLGN